MYKRNRRMLPNIFNDMLIKHTTSHNYHMRQHIAYKIPHCKANTRRKKPRINKLAYTANYGI